jgi:hypothetical protein
MINEISEIAGLPDDQTTYQKQLDFTDKLERFEKRFKSDQ